MKENLHPCPARASEAFICAPCPWDGSQSDPFLSSCGVLLLGYSNQSWVSPRRNDFPWGFTSSCILFQWLAAGGWTHVLEKYSVICWEIWMIIFSMSPSLVPSLGPICSLYSTPLGSGASSACLTHAPVPWGGSTESCVVTPSKVTILRFCHEGFSITNLNC